MLRVPSPWGANLVAGEHGGAGTAGKTLRGVTVRRKMKELVGSCAVGLGE